MIFDQNKQNLFFLIKNAQILLNEYFFTFIDKKSQQTFSGKISGHLGLQFSKKLEKPKSLSLAHHAAEKPIFSKFFT